MRNRSGLRRAAGFTRISGARVSTLRPITWASRKWLLVKKANSVPSRLKPSSGTSYSRRVTPPPVIAVPPDLAAIAPGPILFATDLGPSGDRALMFARQLAAAQGRPLALVHVAEQRHHDLIDEQGPDWLAARDAYHAEVEATVSEWSSAHGLALVAHHVVFGDPPARIAAVAAELQAALVVVGSRNLGLVARAFLSSTASTLAGLAAGPVAVVPNP